MRRLWLVGAAGAALSACALKGDVRRVERQVLAARAETARADSARAVALSELLTLQQRALDTLLAQSRRLSRLEAFQGDLRSDLTDIQRQLVQVQELTGQSQQRLSELRGQLAQRQAGPVAGPGDASRPAGGDPGPEQLYDLSLQQLRRGSPQAARVGFQKFLTDYPTHDRVPDALYFLGETWTGANADSAATAYQRVVRDHANSPRAPAALYKLGLLAEQGGNRDSARVFYQRVVAGYPNSEEASLARNKLQTLGR